MKKVLTATAFVFITHIGFAQGKVGINTTTPQAMLHVRDSSVLFSGGVSLLPTNQHGNPPASGTGIRMMWYPDKAAFRTGYVSGSEWDKNSIGTYSFASGHSSVASGDFSTAMGLNAVADGISSVALGTGPDALGDYSVAIGVSAKTTFSNSISIGTTTKAAGQYSTAMGAFTVSNSYNCFALGRYNDSITGSSRFSWIDTDPLFLIGNGADNNNRNNAVTILKNAKTGINTSSPAAMLHVVRNAPTGGSFISSAQAIFESDQSSYIQFSNLNNHETGFLSGNTSTSIRSGLIFRADSSVVIRSGGNNSRLTISTEGNIGAGTTIPAVKMDIEGGLALDESIFIATASPYTITVGNTSYIRLSSNSTANFRNIVLSDGLTIGQVLIIECTAVSPNGVTLVDNPGASNMDLSSNFTMDQNDTITLLWNGTNWLELHRSVN
jgi:hypothetical protein